MITYTEITEGLKVSVRAFFLEERSNPLKHEFFFIYFVTLENHGSEPVKLLRRHWDIHDSGAADYEVNGEGVVGEQPEIKAGTSYHYNSFCVLKSFGGSMEGTYTMQRTDGTTFDAMIPKFHLAARLN